MDRVPGQHMGHRGGMVGGARPRAGQRRRARIGGGGDGQCPTQHPGALTPVAVGAVGLGRPGRPGSAGHLGRAVPGVWTKVGAEPGGVSAVHPEPGVDVTGRSLVPGRTVHSRPGTGRRVHPAGMSAGRCPPAHEEPGTVVRERERTGGKNGHRKDAAVLRVIRCDLLPRSVHLVREKGSNALTFTSHRVRTEGRARARRCGIVRNAPSSGRSRPLHPLFRMPAVHALRQDVYRIPARQRPSASRFHHPAHQRLARGDYRARSRLPHGGARASRVAVHTLRPSGRTGSLTHRAGVAQRGVARGTRPRRADLPAAQLDSGPCAVAAHLQHRGGGIPPGRTLALGGGCGAGRRHRPRRLPTRRRMRMHGAPGRASVRPRRYRAPVGRPQRGAPRHRAAILHHAHRATEPGTRAGAPAVRTSRRHPGRCRTAHAGGLSGAGQCRGRRARQRPRSVQR
eukprot:ctg_457.g234